MGRRRTIHSGSVFETLAGYSRAVVDGGRIFVAGTAGYDFATGSIEPGAAEQARQALATIDSALAQAGASRADIVLARVFIADAADAAEVTTVLQNAVPAPGPALTMIKCGFAMPEMRVEIEVTASRPPTPRTNPACPASPPVLPTSDLDQMSETPMRRAIYSGSPYEAMAGYSRALVDGDWIFVSGTSGHDPAIGGFAPDAEAQARRALTAIAEALAEAGATMADIVQVRVYLASREDVTAVSRLLGETFADPRPTNTTIICGFPVEAIKVEIEAVARVRA